MSATAVAWTQQARQPIASGSLEALKWLAAIAMVLDHVNAFLLNGAYSWCYAIGRVAIPVFAFTLAHGLAFAHDRTAYRRTAIRLLIAALGSSVAFVPLRGITILNVMFTLLLFVILLQLLERRTPMRVALAAAMFLCGGGVVEGQWLALLTCAGAYVWCRHPSMSSLLLWAAGIGSLSLANGNHWAIAAIPLVWLAACVDLQVPRVRHLFYVFYPAHLFALWAAQAWL